MNEMLVSRVQQSSRKRPIVIPREVCPHCDQSLSIKTLKKHKTLFLKGDGTWIRSNVDQDCTDSDDVEVGNMIKPPDLPNFEMDERMADSMDLDNANVNPSSDDGSCSEYSTDSNSDDHEIWEGDGDDDLIDDIISAPSPPVFSNPFKENVYAVLMWMIGFLLKLQAKYYVSDAAINLLINFFFAFISVTGRFSTFMKELSNIFPRSLTTMLSFVKGQLLFTKYVVCRKCHTLYDYAKCQEKVGSRTETKNCAKVPFPNHPYRSKRVPCNCSLLKSIEVKSGQLFLYPYKIYCYVPLKMVLEKLFTRPSLYEQCRHWKTRPTEVNGMLNDIYDGAIWKEFQSIFLTSFALGLMLNIDWFQPYTHTISSVGVIYLTILNLPRYVRSKRENIILVGVIPGPSEPAHDINAYLTPLVNELLSFWKGVTMDIMTPTGIETKTLRCALLCVSCDLPAARKTCGFLSHSAAFGCSKCLKKFPGTVGSMDYSGFNCSAWPKRTNIKHRESVKRINKCTSKSIQQKMESKLGCRYSVLLDLPYFDPVRMHVIDPMHNLFLGSGKHMMTIWKQTSLVKPPDYEPIQKFIDIMSVPSDVGRIPQKIESGFSGFKADQFKNWITIYSIPSLVDILPVGSLECWRHFVLACRILCKHSLSTHEVDLADILLLQFCRKVEQLYGTSRITPNMHLHAHLKEVIRNYGPLQEFWCFSFERFNGILGKQPSNNRSIEPQLMKRFLRDSLSSSIEFPQSFENDFSHIVSELTTKCVGSLSEPIATNSFKLCSKHTRAVLSPDEISSLAILLPKFNNISGSAVIDVNSIYMKFSSITLKGKVFSSAGKKAKPAVAMALWEEDIYGKPPTSLPDQHERNANIRPVNVHYYCKIVYLVDGVSAQDILASVSWFFPHPERYSLGKPAELWCKSIFEPVGFSCSFAPLKNIICRCAHGIKLHQDENLLVVVPLVE